MYDRSLDLSEVFVPVSIAGLQNDDLVDLLGQLTRTYPISEVRPAIDAYEDPIAMGSALNALVRKLYRESKDVATMIAVGDMGLAYCLKKAQLESDEGKIRELKKLGQVIGFSTAVNCWPGWADAGIVIEEAHMRAGAEIAGRCCELVQELALAPRERGGAHWLVGALELALRRFSSARAAFERAEQIFLTDDATFPYALMARGYIALVQKADPQSQEVGAVLLDEALERLRAEGSKDAIFFADQLTTADRVLIGK